MDKTALLEGVSGLPGEAVKQPRPFMMVVQRYSTLPNWPDTIVLPQLTDEEVLVPEFVAPVGLTDTIAWAPRSSIRQ